MTRSHRRRLAALGTMAALGVPATLLAGCSAGQLAETSKVVAAVPGAQGDVTVSPPSQRISIRNATVDFVPDGYRAGDTARLTLWLINSTDQPVTLTAVHSTAGTVQTCGTAGRPAASASASASGTPSAPGSASASPSAGAGSTSPSASASARPSATASASSTPSQPAGSTTISIPVQPNQLLFLSQGSKDGCLQIAHLAKPLSAGLTVDADFTFTTQSGGTYAIPLTVPFGVSTSAGPRISPSVSVTG